MECIGRSRSAREIHTYVKSREWRNRTWWDTLKSDVRNWCRNCVTCRLVKPQPIMSSEARSELHEKPFRVLFVDFCIIRSIARQFQDLGHDCEGGGDVICRVALENVLLEDLSTMD